MAAPNVGVTGVIQDPGLGGNIARGLGGISQMLMQQDQIRRQQEQEAYQRKLQQDQLDFQRQDREMRLRGAQQQGQGITDLMTPKNVGVNLESMTGIPAPDVQFQVPQQLQDVMARIDPEFRAAFLQSAQPILQDREQQAAIRQKDQAIKSVLANVPANLQMGLRTVIAGKMAGLPDAVVTQMYDTISTQLSPDQIMSLKEQYPMFAELPQADMIRQITEIKSFEAQRKLQLGPEYDRIMARQLAQAKLGIDRARLAMDRAAKAAGPDKEMNSRQAALDIIKQVNDATTNDFTTFGKPLAERVRTLLGENYLQAWQNAQNYLIGQGMAIPQAIPSAPSAPLTQPNQMPGILQTPR